MIKVQTLILLIFFDENYSYFCRKILTYSGFRYIIMFGQCIFFVLFRYYIFIKKFLSVVLRIDDEVTL